MAVLATTKVLLITHAPLEQEFLRYLQKQEVFHLTSYGKERTNVPNVGTELWANLETAIRFLTPYATPRKGIRNMMVGEKVPSSPEQIEQLAKKMNATGLCAEIQKLENAKQEATAEIARLNDEEVFLEEWKDVSQHSDLSSARFATMFCRFPRMREQSLKDDVHGIPEMAYLEILGMTERSILGFIIYQRGEEASIQRFLVSHDGKEVSFDRYHSAPDKEYRRLKREQEEWNHKLAHIEKEITAAAKNIDDLKLLSDYYLWEKQKEQAMHRAVEKGSVAMFEGWILAAELPRLQKELDEHFPETHIEVIEAQEDEIVPVELKNAKFVKPFEIVTKIVGLPAAGELDPTPYLMPFFLVFFGFCITDAGYGIILALTTFLALKFVHMEQGVKEMVRLLFWGGLATIFMGALFGSWFGLEVQYLPTFLQKLQVFDAVKDLQNRVAPFAFALGILHLILGTILGGITKVKNGKVAEAWQTSFLITAILLVAIFWGAVSALQLETLMQPVKYTFLTLSIALLWGLGYGTKNILVRPLIGFLNLVNEVMGLFSSLLSYSRLFALGMATGIVALVFNTLAITIGGVIPIPGVNILMILVILLFGHTLNIVLNVLGAFIHSGRLQFIEFFGRFVGGGGGQFTPLRRESKYLFIPAS